MVSVRRSNHFGAAGHYVWQAAEAGLIGLCTTNGPLILAPTGGVTPTFGNNPLGVGIPAGRHPPILLDIAMSVAPRGKIGLSVAEGKPLPPGWILDRLGRPSTDLADLAAGLGVPIGGHKGYGLALVMEVLAGALSGAGFCPDHHRDKLHGAPPAAGLTATSSWRSIRKLFMATERVHRPRRPDDRADQVGRPRRGRQRDPDPRRDGTPRPRAEPARRRAAAAIDLPRPARYAADAGLHAELDVICGACAVAG